MYGNDRIATRACLLTCVLVVAPALCAAETGGVRAAQSIACKEGGPAESPEPTGVLDLATALAAALAGSPELTAFACEVRAREAGTLLASRLPNPELRLELEDFAGTGERSGDEQTQTTVRLSQPIELAGKRGKRREVAALGRDLAGWDYEAKRLAVLGDTTKAFVSVLAAQERAAVGVEVERLGEEVARRTQGRVDAGAALPVDLAQARLARARAELERRRAERALAAARSALAASWGGSRAEFSHVTGTLDAIGDVPAERALLDRADHNPDVARWTTEMAERAAALRLAEAGRVPDVTVGAGGRYFSDNGDSAMVLELAVPLPVLNQNRDAIAEARYRVDKADAERRAATLAARAALRAAYERLAAAREQATALRTQLVPHARAAVASAREAYEKGLFHLTQVLDAERTLFELRGEEIDTLEAFHLAAADVARLTGAARTGVGGEGDLR